MPNVQAPTNLHFLVLCGECRLQFIILLIIKIMSFLHILKQLNTEKVFQELFSVLSLKRFQSILLSNIFYTIECTHFRSTERWSLHCNSLLGNNRSFCHCTLDYMLQNFMYMNLLLSVSELYSWRFKMAGCKPTTHLFC
jgi:hypothetical protein